MDTGRICFNCFGEIESDCSPCPHCGYAHPQAQNPPHQLRCGTVLSGKYLVGRSLGQGGFGITYTGWDLNLELKIAIKEYYPEGFASRELTMQSTVLPLSGRGDDFFVRGREKFVDEAKALAKFSNLPGVVNVRDYFTANGTAYIVMEFLDGRTLKEISRERGRMPVGEVLQLLEPVFYSLQQVHAAGILHRDISPDNIIVRREGGAKLLDFGAARQFSIKGEKSNTINVKHGFAPEEQYRTRGEQGPWTDIYALCATIYALTTGKLPPQALDRLAGEAFIPPNSLGADFSPEQQAALTRGLSIKGSDRQQMVSELYRDLYGKTPAWAAPPPLVAAPAGQSAPAGAAAVSGVYGQVSASPAHAAPAEPISGSYHSASGGYSQAPGGYAPVSGAPGSGGYSQNSGGYAPASGAPGSGGYNPAFPGPYPGGPGGAAKKKKLPVILAASISGAALLIIVAVLLLAKRGGGDDPQPSPAQSTAPAPTATATATPTPEPTPTQPVTADPYTPTLWLSDEYVVLSPGDMWDIDMEVINPPAEAYSLVYTIADESIVSAVWGDWYGEDSITLTLTCLAEGSTTVYIDILSEDEYTVYSTSTVYVEAGAAGRLDTGYLDELIGNTYAGVEVIDVTRGMSYSSSYSEDSMAASALINIPILFTAALYVDYGDMSMSDGILFRYTSGGRGSLSSAYSGSYLSLDELLANMLLYSDNNASNSLLDYFGFDTLNEICSESGFNSVYASSYLGSGYDNYASASDIAWMLYYMWDDNLSLGRKYLAEHMYIADDYARIGLGAYLPSECAFLNHNGFKDGVYAEAAVVFSGEEIYIVSFVGNGGSYWDLAALAGEIGYYVQYCLG